MVNIRKTSSLLLWVLSLVSYATLSCVKEAPRPKLATLQCNLGNLDAKHRVQTTFADFTNQGSGESVTINVKIDCDCTTVQYPKGVYKHCMGDKIKIRTDLTPFFLGSILEKVVVHVNDQPKSVVITIKENAIWTE